MSTFQKEMSMRVAALLSASLFPVALTGCYVVPIGPDGQPRPLYAVPVQPAPIPNQSPAHHAPAQPSGPVVLQARLYPANDIATQTGVLGGTVTNTMGGKGRFQLAFQGDVLSGEATRVNGDARRGVASAYGTGGNYMTCDYQMHTPYQGAGTCLFSNGGRYQVHIGN